ncbi:MAG: undecaprenyl/decaprenyl-phosphate alpha-N-acetylglucosaminyl 1-phosphate transferase [Ruminococcaceae bacterium]|nr:undecaprenyl/decaprenyl-phosphate alpha-N-acetylglucosaminyl 1-phosphate transferase [Oscillospiraceae bacterium]
MNEFNAYDLLMGLLALVFSGLLSFTLTPLVRVLAFKIGAVDTPKDDRRMHKKPMPLIGGLAIFLGFAISALLFCNITKQLAGMLLGACVIVLVGIADDVKDLNPWVKLGGQILAALIIVFFDMRIEFINIFGKYIVFGVWSYPITVMWIVLLTNAINLIDGLDGLACGVSTISSVCLLIFTVLKSEPEIALITAILTGACMGFLPFNTNPAKIFMGDTGALMLGFLLSVISVQGLFKFNAVISFWVPFMIFGLPFGDTAFAFLRRLLTGKHPFHGDRGHLHHRLIDMGFSQKQSVGILYAISAICGISAILFSEERIVTSVLIIIVAVTIGILNLQIFKHGDENTCEMTGVELKGKTAAANNAASSVENSSTKQ